MRAALYTGIMVVSSTLLAALAATAVAASAGTATRPRIVALGDSLTSGHGIGASRAFPSVLQQRLQDHGYDFTVVNAGVSGDTSARAVARFREALRPDVQFLIVALGANDGLRGVPVEQLRRSLPAADSLMGRCCRKGSGSRAVLYSCHHPLT